MQYYNLYIPFVSLPNVTDNGEAVEESRATTQAISYIPYGEIFVEQQSGGWSSPYLFNAKELDSETGLYYYGARYLDPSDAMWLSVDPLWEKYVGMTPYQYCAGNPVKLVDVDGMQTTTKKACLPYKKPAYTNAVTGGCTVVRGYPLTNLLLKKKSINQFSKKWGVL